MSEVGGSATDSREALPKTVERPRRLMRGWCAARRMAKASWAVSVCVCLYGGGLTSCPGSQSSQTGICSAMVTLYEISLLSEYDDRGE